MTTKKDREIRVNRLRLDLDLPKDATVTLESMDPGDGRRYQISIDWEKDGKRNQITMPRNYHMRTKDFDCFLDGILEVIEEPRLLKLIKYRGE